MKFIFLCTAYPVITGDSYMTSELAEALRSQHHDVDVVHIDWNGEPNTQTEWLPSPDGISILRLYPRTINKLGTLVYRVSKLFWTSRHAAQEMDKFLDLKSYDAVIAWTPALTVFAPLLRLVRNNIKNCILFVFDFFPIHHKEIGMIPSGPVFWVAKAWESFLYRKFTTIICNFPSNIAYLKKNYALKADQRIVSTPLWSNTDVIAKSSSSKIRTAFGLPVDTPIAIFGGQITDGRGIEQMLDAAMHAEKLNSDIIFLFVGNGRLVDLVKARAANSRKIKHIPGLPRDEYLSLLSSCDVGLIATVQGVSSFSFPTKTIDYLRAGLPIVAAVESGSDYIKMLEQYRIGYAVPFNRPVEFSVAALQLVEDKDFRKDMRTRAKTCLDEIFHIRHTVAVILEAL